MKHILIVEDEQHLAIGIKYNLEAEGYDVSVAGDGPTALKMIEEDPVGIDLVILDLMLPGMSGYAVCKSLREAGLSIPVLILTARSLTEDRIRGFDVGADQYLQKPFELDELISRVRNLLGRHNRQSIFADRKNIGPTYEFGRAKINFDTFEVTVAGVELRLTHTEMKLLRHFIENEGSVVSRAQLLEDVWGMSSSPTTRTIDNFIVRLRKYFEVDPAEPRHFLSVRGAGYRFVAKVDDDESVANTEVPGGDADGKAGE
jgi:two-component system alkaline phosphatase synthesis response regulator PhoP